jgi:hypothetical protein
MPALPGIFEAGKVRLRMAFFKIGARYWAIKIVAKRRRESGFGF